MLNFGIRKIQWLFLISLLLLACIDDKPQEIITVGEFGESIPLELHNSLLLAEVRVDGSDPRPFLIDTGAQFVLLDVPFATSLGYGSTPTPLTELTVGQLTFLGVEALSWDLEPFASALGVPIEGILGASLFSHVPFAVDTQRLELTFLEFDEEEDGLIDEDQVEPTAYITEVTTQFGFALTNATLESSLSVQLILDTGAGTTVLFESAFEDLGTENRPLVEGLQGLGAAGAFDLSFSRLCGLSLGEATLDDVHIGIIPDDALGDAARMLPEMQGLVGSSFFREFLTIFDIPRAEARFYRYRDRSHIPQDEFVQLGFEIERTTTNDAIIIAVFENSDAQDKGLIAGDIILSIDGVAVNTLLDTTLSAAIHGSPGEVRTLELADLEGTRTVEVLVEDLIPPCD